jgi:PKD repeat protein
MAGPLLRADCSLTHTGNIPLNDLGPGSYQGFTAGLYPAGSNMPPPAHAAAALAIATDQIKPLNALGNPDSVNGKIVMISIGMSNATQEFASKGAHAFRLDADIDPAKDPQLVIVDGAQSGQDAPAWIDPNAATWSVVDLRLLAAGVTPEQVQVAWVKEALIHPNNYGAFPAHAQMLQSDLEIILRNLKTNFPNIKIAYLSTRTRAYTNTPADENPEPFAYETGFAVKWTIEDQINGAGNLNFDPAQGAVVAPLILWGPYIWADGLTARSDGLTWLCSDLESDFTHPSANGGVPKVADQLLAFFKTDPTATPWFLKTVTGQPPMVTAGASVSSGAAPLRANFTASASDPDGTIIAYQWTFDDGTFSIAQNPEKTFPAPGNYSVHVTVTDNSGNTTLRTLPISAASQNPTPTPTATVAPTPTPSPTPTATAAATAVPTATATPTTTSTPAITPTPVATSTPTPTATATPTTTSTPAATPTPTPVGTPTPTAAPTATPTPSPTPMSKAINLSTRIRVQTGNNVGVGGFIVTGSAPKHVLIRGIGPSLTGFGVLDVLADPVLDLHGPGAFATITNDNWRQTQEAEILATGIPPADDLESAIVATLAPGAYTAIVRGNGNTSGVALVEVYDLNQGVDSKLANLSTRAFVGTDNNIVIAGFLLSDESVSDRVVVRGIGPSLAPGSFPASTVLADPTLELRDTNGTLLIANNDWQDSPTQAAELTAAGLAPASNLESAIVATLSPGLYTALLSGANNGTGIGVVEVYDRGTTP